MGLTTAIAEGRRDDGGTSMIVHLPTERNNASCRDPTFNLYVGPHNGEQGDQVASVPNEA